MFRPRASLLRFVLSILATSCFLVGTASADLLVADRDHLLPSGQVPADMKAVWRFAEGSTYPLTKVPGGVAPGAGGLQFQTGLAVGPDNTIYVSDIQNSVIRRYDSNGNFVGNLGLGALAAPTNLAFGPNGNLYVSDIAGGPSFSGAVVQFNTATLSHTGTDLLALAPAGLAFASNGDLILGSVFDGSVSQYNSSNALVDTLIPGGTLISGVQINPGSIVRLPNNNLLIADLSFVDDAPDHHQIVIYNAATDSASQFINLTTPVDPADNTLPQPTSLLLDRDGNLLVALGPAHFVNGVGPGAVQKYNSATGAFMATVVDNLGAPLGLAFIVPEPATWVFAMLGSMGFIPLARRRLRRLAH